MTELQTNGPSDGKYIDQIDPENPEYIRQLRRPAEVKEDLTQMQERARTSLIMKSQAFREELEEIIADQMRAGPHPASLLALQQISELILPQGKTSSGGSRVSGAVMPIADIRGVDSLNYTKGEKLLRNKVAATYRLMDLHGWSHGFSSLLTCRISQDHEHFLVIPYGLLYAETTAANLIKVGMRGEMLDHGSTNLTLNSPAFTLHSAIHQARPDVKCVIHIRNDNAVAVSVMNCGLLPLCHEAMVLGEVTYYEYAGMLSDQEEREKLTRALGPSSKVMFLRSYGVLVGGETVEEAFFLAQNVMTACDIQLRTVPVGLDNLVLPSDETRKKALELSYIIPAREGTKKKWKRGDLEFEALMRNLDYAGYRTGYPYHQQLLSRTEKRDRANSDVEIPPTASSFAYYEPDGRTPLKNHLEKQKKAFKTEWLNSPNAYKKEEFDETGTPYPKKITKWVSESDEQSTPVRVENPNQFAPQGENPKELKQKFKEIRKEYYEEKVSAGPQSRILEGISWDEAQRMKDGHVSGTSDTMIVVGAASKGIIQRDHQHNAVVYKTYYQPNPFDSMSEDEIARYKEEVETKAKGGAGEPVATETQDLTPGPDGHLISTEERLTQVRQTTVEVAPQTQEAQQQGESPVQETNLDEAVVAISPSKSSKQEKATPATVETGTVEVKRTQRSQSARLPPQKSKKLVQELQKSLDRRSKDDSAINGDEAVPAGSPTKSMSSGDGTMEERSSREGSPTKEVAADMESPEKGGDKKKKKKFRMPSFSTKKEKKEKK